MNKRQKKKRDKEAIKLAKKIEIHILERDIPQAIPYWDYISQIKRADTRFQKFRRQETKYLDLDYWYERYKETLREYKEVLREQEMLLKVCRKCLKDGFHLEEYFYWETPYMDKNGWIILFMHYKDYSEYHHLGKKDTKIREIGFWCPYNAHIAIPQDNQGQEHETCEEAIWDD